MKVLVGVDGGAAQADAVRLAADLAAADGRVIAATTMMDAGRVLDLADEQLRDVQHDVRVARGHDPAEALHQIARDTGADVLVVGSTHHGRAGRTLLGATGDRVLHHAPCPVAVAPHGYAHTNSAAALKRIGVAYDGCHGSRAALAWARALALRIEAQVTVVSVADTGGFAIDPALPAITSDEVIVNLHKSRKAELDEVVKTLPAEVRPKGLLLDGPVAPTLVRASHDFDLVVCGTRSHGPVGAALLGSVSHKLMHEAAAPLVIVPRTSVPSNSGMEASAPAVAG